MHLHQRLAIVVLVFTSFVEVMSATSSWELIQTTDGKLIRNAKLISTDEVGIKVLHDAGISKILFSELPKEISSQFKFDAAVVAQAQAAKKNQDEQARVRIKEIDLAKDAEKQRREEMANRGAALANESAARKQADAFALKAAEFERIQEQQRIASMTPIERVLLNLKSWIGHPRNELIQAIGVPKANLPDGAGGEVMAYEYPISGGNTTITQSFIPGTFDVSTSKQFLVVIEVYSDSTGIIYKILPRPVMR